MNGMCGNGKTLHLTNRALCRLGNIITSAETRTKSKIINQMLRLRTSSPTCIKPNVSCRFLSRRKLKKMKKYFNSILFWWNLIPAMLLSLECVFFKVDTLWYIIFVMAILNWLAVFSTAGKISGMSADGS